MAVNNIDSFMSTFRTRAFARANRFEAEIFQPVGFVENADLRDLSLRIQSIQFPGRNIRSVTNETVYGPTYELAQGVTYADEMVVTFYLSSDHRERWFFDAWQSLIYDPQTYNLEYYNNYTSTMKVYQLTNDEDVTLTLNANQNFEEERGGIEVKNEKRIAGIEIRNVFPKTLNPLDYSQESNNQILLMQVGFSFREWVPLVDLDSTEGGNAKTDPQVVTNLLQIGNIADLAAQPQQNQIGQNQTGTRTGLGTQIDVANQVTVNGVRESTPLEPTPVNFVE